jgi:hypothetical protein
MVYAVALTLVLGSGLFVGVYAVVSALRSRARWRGEGLIMHELIAPAGELQDPQFGDRRLGFSDDAAETPHPGKGDHSLMGRAPWSVPRSSRGVRHG